MRRPSILALVLGNRVAQLLFFAVSLCAICVLTQVHDGRWWVVALMGVGLGRYAGRARAELIAFRSWKQEWAQMSGEAAAETATSARPRRRFGKGMKVILLAAWVMLGAWLQDHHRDTAATSYAFANLGFGVLTLWGLGAAVLGIVRRSRRSARKQKAAATKPAEFIVRVVPSTPRSSPSIAQIRSALPAYCKRLMTAGSASPDAL